MSGTEIRVMDGIPTAIDFASGHGTPVILNELTGRGYAYLQNTVTTIFGDTAPTALSMGAVGDGITDDTTAIQNYFTFLGSNCEATFPASTYLVTGTITIAGDRVNIRGAGQKATTIKFNPSTPNQICFLFSNGTTASQVQCSLRGFAFDATGNTQAGKVAVNYVTNEELTLEDLAVSNWSDATKSCIGIKSNGFQTVRHIYHTINCDIPYDIEQNTNRASHGNIDTDHYSFHDIYAIADTTKPCFQVADGVNLSHMHFSGYQAWVLGKYGFYWVDTTTILVGIALSFENVRWEQEVAGGFMFYIRHNLQLQQLSFKNCYGGLNGGGYSLRKVQQITFDNVFYVGGTGAQAMDIDSSCDMVSMHAFVKNAIPDPWTLTATNIEGSFYNGANLISYLPAPKTGIGAATTQKINPSTTKGFAQFENPGFSVAAGASVKLCSQATQGLLMIYVPTGPVSAVMAINGPSNSSRVLSFSDVGWFGAAAAAANLNIYWDAGNNWYAIQNTLGVPLTVSVTFFGSLGEH